MHSALRLLWAKSSPFMSLWTHSMCTGTCTEIYLSARSSSRILDYLANQFGAETEDVIHIVSYLASVHDIGKAHPAFQNKDNKLMRTLVENVPEAFDHHRAEPLISSFRHEYYSAAVLRRIWKTKGYSGEVSCVLSSIVALHHQKPGDRQSLIEPRNGAWAIWQNELEEAMSVRYLHQVKLKTPAHTDAACMLISSIIILMDWVSSSELFRDAENLSSDEVSGRALRVLGLYGLTADSVFPMTSDFSDLFPGIMQPRPLQIACKVLSDRASLTIIEAPMGEGKTEAALFAAARMCNATNARGLYIALPSQATSNQMHTRVDDMLAGLHYGDARLLHGTAFLSEHVPDTFSSEDEAAAAKWVRPSRMGLLGANAVGTVDQAMAAVIRTRFSMLRLAGLSNKILIIDEIHAYDLYMSQIIGTLLRWCHDTGIPVVLLSATMQMAQKERYLSCFDADTSSGITDAYPVITQVLPDHTINQFSVDASTNYHYLLRPVRMGYDDESIAVMAMNSIANGGCLAIMVNTVRHAQEIYRALLNKRDDETIVLLFHSRFTLKRRAEIEKKCVELFGKNRSMRPGKAILVATQVVEQSIDLDFDGMISELAPIDLLLQRAGRLHRHRENKRLACFSEPVIEVILPSETDPEQIDKRYGSSGYVYDPFLLNNTEHFLTEDRIIRIPEDVRGVIEKVYSTVTDENREAWLKRNFEGMMETAKAKGCTWPMPSEDTFFPMETTMYYDIAEPEDGFDTASEASTRLGDDGIRIAFCSEDAFDRYKEIGIPLQDQVAVYLNSVQVRLKVSAISQSDATLLIRKGKLSGIWLLRGETQVELDNLVITNDPELGIYWEVR